MRSTTDAKDAADLTRCAARLQPMLTRIAWGAALVALLGTGCSDDGNGASDEGLADDGGPPIEGSARDCDFSESFDAPDGSAWPGEWRAAGGAAISDVMGGRGRLAPTTNAYALARMVIPLVDCTNAEAEMSVELTDGGSQGIGLYVRQNGGLLQSTTPPGEGYAAFIENFRSPAGIGVWREVEGDEQLMGAVASTPVDAGVRYRLKVRVTQQDDSTTLVQGKLWPEGDAEPGDWQAQSADTTPALQNAGGSLAIDAYNSMQSGEAPVVFVDDIVVREAT